MSQNLLDTGVGILNYGLDQGSSFEYSIKIEDTTEVRQPDGTSIESRTPKNLSGYTARSQLRYDFDDAAPAVSFTATIPVPSNGTIVLILTAAQTASLTQEQAYHDVEIENAEGIVDKVVRGVVLINKEVTK